jgi:hypothetical protein
LRAKVFSKSCTGLNPIAINCEVMAEGSRLLAVCNSRVYRSLAVLLGKAGPWGFGAQLIVGLETGHSAKSIKPTTSLVSVVEPLRLVTQTSIRNICTCEVTMGKFPIALL